MSFGLGFWAAAGAGGVAGGEAYEQISTTVLGSTSSTITFSSIPSTYKHLQLRIVSRNNSGNIGRQLVMQFNSDTGFNYTSHAINGTPSFINATNRLSDNYIYFIGASNGATANNFSANIVDILDYANTSKNTTTRTLGGLHEDGIRLQSGAWYSTSAITSITLSNPSTESYMTGSRFTLYGIRG
jgi:hypothetical protein